MDAKIQISGGEIKFNDGKIQLFKPFDPCPDIDKICVTFDGIRICGNCRPVTSTAGPYWDVAEQQPMNGSFELTRVFPCQWEGTGGTVHLRKFTDFQCNVITDECDTNPFRIV